jgi:hypothetical protein
MVRIADTETSGAVHARRKPDRSMRTRSYPSRSAMVELRWLTGIQAMTTP